MSQSRIIREELSAREQRILKTARIYYEEGLNLKEIAEEHPELPKHQTLKEYKADDFWKQLKRVYTDREAFLLKKEIEEEIDRADREAQDWLSIAATMADSSRAYTQAAKQRMNHIEKKVKILQEIGLFDKPGTKRPEPDNDDEEERTQVVFEMDEAVEQKMQEEAGVNLDAS